MFLATSHLFTMYVCRAIFGHARPPVHVHGPPHLWIFGEEKQ